MYLKIMILLYADDTVLFSDSESDMKHSLEMFDLYCKTWQLTVNIEKKPRLWYFLVVEINNISPCLMVGK